MPICQLFLSINKSDISETVYKRFTFTRRKMSDCKLSGDILPIKLSGCGDGIKNVTKPTPKKNYKPSARKFTARTPKRDDGIRLKLEESLVEFGEKIRTPAKDVTLRKVNSVAEITPTKSKKKKLPNGTVNTATDERTLHATPRAAVGKATSASGRSPQEERRAGRLIYQRLLLVAWRRNRARLATLTESSRRHRDQIDQLELQVDVLQNLRKSECNRREEALQECHQLKTRLTELQEENQSLNMEKAELEEQIAKLEENIDIMNVDLGNAKNDLQRYKHQTKVMEQQLEKERDRARRKNEERIDLMNKITRHESTIKAKEETITNLEENLRNTESSLKEMASQKASLENDYDELTKKMETIQSKNKKLENQAFLLKRDKMDLEHVVEDLQSEFSGLLDSYDHLKEENEMTKSTIVEICNERNSWLSSIKQLGILSAGVFKTICYVMLPAIPRDF